MNQTLKKLLAAFLALTMLFSLLPTAFAVESATVPPALTKVSDPITIDPSANYSYSTADDGKIWTDKSVSKDGTDFGLEGADLNEMDLSDMKSDEFAVALSAIGQSYAGVLQTRKANICIVIDLSTSMVSNRVNGVTRLQIFIDEMNNFLARINSLSDYDINISIAAYAGSGVVLQPWTHLDGTTLATMQENVSNTTNFISQLGDNTNSALGAYMARALYSDYYAGTTTLGTNVFNRPDNYADAATRNYVLFMTDGAPNRYQTNYANDAHLEISQENILLQTRWYTAGWYYGSAPYGNNNTSTKINGSSDYKKMAAYQLLQQAEKFQEINNVHTYSVGLGEWFTQEAADSAFPTAVYLSVLVAAVATGSINRGDGQTVTAQYCWDNFLGYDVPDGAMPGNNPAFPDLALTAANFGRAGSYSIQVPGNSMTPASFATMEEMLAYINAEATRSLFQVPVGGSGRTQDTTFTTLDECGIPAINAALLNSVSGYFAGNTVETFAQSLAMVEQSIVHSFMDYLTDVDSNIGPKGSGYVTILDPIDESMEFRSFAGVRYGAPEYALAEPASESEAPTPAENGERDISAGNIFNGHAFPASVLADYEADGKISFWSEYSTNVDEGGAQVDIVYNLHEDVLNDLTERSIRAGDIYYNSDTDFGCSLRWYATGRVGISNYIAPYYNADGTKAPVPENATFMVERFCLSASTASSAIGNEQTRSLSYLNIYLITDLSDGSQMVLFAIPAYLLPVIHLHIDETTGLVENQSLTNPVSLFYTVGLRADAPAESFVKGEQTDGSFRFTTHLYDTAKESDPSPASSEVLVSSPITVLFPAQSNPYYGSSDLEIVYVKNADDTYSPVTAEMAQAAGGIGNLTLYLLNEYADRNGTYSEYILLNDYYTYALSELRLNEGYYVLHKATRNDAETTIAKSSNATETNPLRISGRYIAGAAYGRDIFCIYLGNNGRIDLGSVEDYAVVDFGLPVSVLTADIGSLSAALPASLRGISVAENAAGTVLLSADETAPGLTFTPTTTNFAQEVDAYGFCDFTSGTATSVCVARVRFLPATNVYYEEGFLTLGCNGGDLQFEQIGTQAQVSQSAANLLYGNDAAYQTYNENSLGSALGVSVSDSAVQPTAQFTFTGTGFDILSRTTPDSGTMAVYVHVGEDTTGALAKFFLVDNYLAEDSLYQLPVVHYTDLAYGTYTVQIRAYYHPIFDHNYNTETPARRSLAAIPQSVFDDLGVERSLCTLLAQEGTAAATRAIVPAAKGSYNVYLDGVRIYNPLGTLTDTASLAYTAYAAPESGSELNPTYSQIRDRLLDAASWSDGTNASGILYIADGTTTEQGGAVIREGIFLSSSGKLHTEIDTVDGKEYLIDATRERITFTRQSEPDPTEPTTATDPVEPAEPTTETDPAEPTTETDPVEPTPPAVETLALPVWTVVEDGSGNVVDPSVYTGEMFRKLYVGDENGEGLQAKYELQKEDIESISLYYYDDVFKSRGPENEVYLQNGNGIAFSVELGSTVHISAKSPNGKAVNLEVFDGTVWHTIATIATATELYYNVGSYLTDTGGKIILRCTSTDEAAILSLCGIKQTDSSSVAETNIDAELAFMALRAAGARTNAHTHRWVTTLDVTAGCTSNGAFERICTICGSAESEAFAAAGHHVENGSCTHCGLAYHTVIFTDGETLLDTQVVANGENASYPAAPVREGYRFNGWSASAKNIRASLTITARYVSLSEDEPTVPEPTVPEPTEPEPTEPEPTEPEPTEPSIYDDVAPDAWYADEIAYVTANGMMNGVGKGKFDPEGEMTRAMLVTVLWRMENEPEAKSAAPFADVATGRWYSEAVAWAYENRIVLGVDAATFAPDEAVTREQSVTIFSRYAAMKGKTVSSTASLADFVDAGMVSDYALTPIRWAVETKLIIGSLDGGVVRLAPKGTTTRAEAATLLMRYAQLLAQD